MKELKIELNQDYKQFKNGFEKTLKGDLVILSGVNGSGKTQLMEILNKRKTMPKNISSEDIAKYNIDSNVNIDECVLTNSDIAKQSFKDNIGIINISNPEPRNVYWNKEQAWNYFSNYLNWMSVESTHSKSKNIIKGILIKNNYNSEPVIDLSSYQNTKTGITEKQFKNLIPDDFIWEEDDLFSNSISKLFYNFASKRQDVKAEYGEASGGFNNKEYIKNAPWTKLNKLFGELKFNYRFKEDFEFITPNLKEKPVLYPILISGDIDENSPRELADLSDGEKAIISLTFALLNEENRPIEKLLLLDEFDNTLNPSLIEAFFVVVEEFFIKKGIMVVMTTHSPVTISLAPDYAVFYELFKQDNDSPKILQVQKGEYSELKIANKDFYSKIENQELRIKELEKTNNEIERALEATKILFVEDTYTQIYKLAWLKLNNIDINKKNLEAKFEDNASFKILGKGNKDNLKGFLDNPSMEEWKSKNIVGLFDFDDAFKCFYELNKDWTKIQGDEATCLYRKRNKYENISAIVLPVPCYRKNIAKMNQKVKQLEVELLFKDEDIKNMYNNDEITEELVCENLKIFKIRNKRNFWIKAISLDKDKFNAFQPLFDKINELLKI